MKKRAITLFACLAAVVVITAAYFVFDMLNPDIDDEQDDFFAAFVRTPGIRLISPDPFAAGDDDFEPNRRWTDLNHFHINVYGEEGIHLRRGLFGEWFSVTRPRLPLEQDSVVAFAIAFAALEARELFIEEPEEEDLRQFGLHPAIAHISAEYADGVVYNVYIGEFTPDRRFRYVTVEGRQGIYLVDAFMIDAYPEPIIGVQLFFQGYDWIVDRTLPLIDLNEIETISITRRDFLPILIEPADEQMMFDFPQLGLDVAKVMLSPIYNAPVSMWGVHDEVIAHLNELPDPHMGGLFTSLVDIDPDDLAPFGLDDPVLDILITFFDGAIYRLTIGNNTEEGAGGLAYAMFSGLDGVWRAQNIRLFRLLELTPFHMILRTITNFHIDNVVRIELGLVSGYFDIHLEHTGEIQLVDGREVSEIIVMVNGEEFEGRAMRSLYSRIMGLVREAMTDTHAPQGEPLEWIRLHLSDGRELLHEFFHNTAAFHGISTNGGDITYLISRNALVRMNNYMQEFMNREGIFR